MTCMPVDPSGHDTNQNVATYLPFLQEHSAISRHVNGEGVVREAGHTERDGRTEARLAHGA